jgi:NarL family two-component system response regulator LiaR
MNQIRVLIVDDHLIARQGIRVFLDNEPSIEVVGEAGDGQDALCQAQTLQPEVILMDLVMPRRDGIDAIVELKRCLPHVKIIALTTFGDELKVKATMEAGADGYLLKDIDGDALLDAIHAVQRGDMPIHPHVAPHLVRNVTKGQNANGALALTDREKQVLRLVAKGFGNKAVGIALGISEGTARNHVSKILHKLNVSSRTEAAVEGMKLGLIAQGEDG